MPAYTVSSNNYSNAKSPHFVGSCNFVAGTHFAWYALPMALHNWNMVIDEMLSTAHCSHLRSNEVHVPYCLVQAFHYHTISSLPSMGMHSICSLDWGDLYSHMDMIPVNY